MLLVFQYYTLRCLSIIKKRNHIRSKYKINKKIKIFLIIILIFSSFKMTGCIEQNIQKKGEYEYINLSYNNINNSLKQAIKWLISNIDENGFYNYVYNINEMEYIPYNNIYHQLKNSQLLAILSYYNDTIKNIHKTNLNSIIDNYYNEENNIGYILFENKSELGMNAIVLRTFLSSPYNTSYKEYINKIAKTILLMQNNNGSFQYDFLSNNTNKLNIIHSSEAIISLMDMYISTGNQTYLNKSILSQKYFIKNYLNNINITNYSELIPGHIESLAKLYNLTNDDSYILIIKFLSDFILEHQEIRDISNIGHFFNLNFDNNYYSNSSIDGYFTEGLTYAYEIFKNDIDINITRYEIGLILGSYNIINLQYKDNNNRMDGAIKYSHSNDLIRIDATQNGINTFLKIIEVFNEKGNWNYLYYPELNLLTSNNQTSRLQNEEVWYALFLGTVLSIIIIFLVYLMIKKKR